MSHFAAVLDANVLYSYPLTSVLLELAEARLYRPIWSKDIHEEYLRGHSQPAGHCTGKIGASPRCDGSGAAGWACWDFPATVLEEFDVAAQHPDTFLRHLVDLAPNIVRAGLAMMIESLSNPPMTTAEYFSSGAPIAAPVRRRSA